MLIHYAFPRFVSFSGGYIFRQDGEPPHHSTRFRTYLSNKMPNNWIRRGGPVEWPPRSPDLTLCDFSVGPHKRNGVENFSYNHRRSENSNSKGLHGNPTRCFEESVILHEITI